MAILWTLIAVVTVALVVCLVLLVAVTAWNNSPRVPEVRRRATATLAERNLAKGNHAEDQVARYQIGSLPPTDYTAYHNLYIPRVDGRGTTEIDHAVVSRFGVFVIETKSWPGRLTGSEHDDTWTQELGRRTHQKDNPLKQNRLHTRSLAKFLSIDSRSVHSVVCLYGRDVTFGGQMPANVVRAKDLARHIRSHQREVLNASGVDRVNRILTDHVESSDAELDRAMHLKGIRSRRRTGPEWP